MSEPEVDPRMEMDIENLVEISPDVPFSPTSEKENSEDVDSCSPEWTDHVIKQLTEDELINGNPTTDGLRRVTEKLLGPITRSESHVVQSPTPQNDNHAVVEHTIEIYVVDNLEEGLAPHSRVFTDAADVFANNTPEEFAKHSVATACTKAEGRALRKALKLRRVYSFEEMQDSNNDAEPGKISTGQISFMNMICERCDINVLKLLRSGKTVFDKVEDIPYAAAVKINDYLGKIQNGMVAAPESVMGYDAAWRTESE